MGHVRQDGSLSCPQYVGATAEVPRLLHGHSLEVTDGGGGACYLPASVNEASVPAVPW